MRLLLYLFAVLVSGCVSVFCRSTDDPSYIEVYENERLPQRQNDEADGGDDDVDVDTVQQQQRPLLPRWTSSESIACLNPVDQSPPDNFEWSSPWRIYDAAASSPSSDGTDGTESSAPPPPSSALAHFGWSEGPFHRRRRWVRSIRRVWSEEVEVPSAAPLSLSRSEPRRSEGGLSSLYDGQYSDDVGAGAFSKRRRIIPPQPSAHDRLGDRPQSSPPLASFSSSAAQAAGGRRESEPPPKGRRLSRASPAETLALLSDDFLFRGLGVSVYKSFLYQYAGGISLRIPLSPNFLSYYNRPELPTLSCSVGLYYPWTAGFFLSASLPAEVVAIMLHRLSIHLRNLQLCRGDPRRIPVDSSPIKYSQDVSQRVGVSLSWRYSPSTGWRCLLAPWAMYLPSVRFLLRAVARIIRRLSAALSRLSLLRRLRAALPPSSAASAKSAGVVVDSPSPSPSPSSLSASSDAVFDRSGAPSSRPATTPRLSRRVSSWLFSKSAGLGLTSTVYGDGMTGSVVLQLSSFFPEVGRITRALGFIRTAVHQDPHRKVFII